MENISDDEQTLQSDDAKTGKYEIMETVVNMYLNEQTIWQTTFCKELYKPLIVGYFFFQWNAYQL